MNKIHISHYFIQPIPGRLVIEMVKTVFSGLMLSPMRKKYQPPGASEQSSQGRELHILINVSTNLDHMFKSMNNMITQS
jgi:hypothetical protein